MAIVGSSAVQPCPQACAQICAEIAKADMLQDEGAIAEAMYKPMGQRSVDGFTEVTDPDDLAALDLTVEDLNPEKSGFRAGVFQNDDTGDYVIGFKGTTFSSLEDWKNNAQQGLTSRSDYYRRAQSIARFAGDNAGSDGVGNVKYVGHSLGGGLASAAAHASGQPATTFNSAGLHGFNRSWFNAPPIDAVRVRGEILTAVQGAIPLLAPEAVGTPYRIPPHSNTASAAQRAELTGWDALRPVSAAARYTKAALMRAVDLHGMEAVNASLDQRMEQLQQQADAEGCQC